MSQTPDSPCKMWAWETVMVLQATDLPLPVNRLLAWLSRGIPPRTDSHQFLLDQVSIWKVQRSALKIHDALHCTSLPWDPQGSMGPLWA